MTARKPEQDGDLQIRLSVSLSDGSFESNLSFPVNAVAEHKDELVKMWLSAMQVGLKGYADEPTTQT